MKPTFRPLPLLGNGHVQTVLGAVLKGPRFHHPTRVRLVALSNNDHLAIHDSLSPMWKAGDPIVVLVHGMGGTAKSAYLQRVGRRFWERGWRIVRVDLRGSGHGVTFARGIYHAGVSDDIRRVLDRFAEDCPTSPVVLVGFSLGGNIVLKCAGELGASPANLAGVAAVAPPIDLQACSRLISTPNNRFYDRKFVRDLVKLARTHHLYHPDIPLPTFPPRLTVRQFDEVFTAPRGGFANADDYYARASASVLIDQIAVPTLILTARDDPFIAAEPFEAIPPRDRLRVEITERGGHLGYLGHSADGGRRWAEYRIVEWATARSFFSEA